MDNLRIRYIYEITNLVNGKTYIGQHTVRKNRTITSDTYMGSGSILKEAYRKYGKSSFKKKILISGFFSKEQIDTFERCMIACQKICGKAKYNLARGGDGGDLSKFIDYSKVGKSIHDAHKNGRYKGSYHGWTFHGGMKGKNLSEESKQKN